VYKNAALSHGNIAGRKSKRFL